MCIVIVVPTPASEVISKSSINRRAPGSPRPRPPEVEYPVGELVEESYSGELTCLRVYLILVCDARAHVL